MEIKKPTERERELYAHRVASIYPYITKLNEYGFDVIKEFGGFDNLREFCDYLFTCSGNRYMSILEGCMRVLNNYKERDRRLVEDVEERLDAAFND